MSESAGKPPRLPDKWAPFLATQPETGMGYWIVTVVLKDRREYRRVVVDSGYVTRVYGHDHIPFDPEDIVDIIVTHDKWDFR
ncbi:MAG: hypothetical protein M1570_01405 [Chloroflexi bacterium]|nr:hypothetical protein [Chloroflexota bacterium]